MSEQSSERASRRCPVCQAELTVAKDGSIEIEVCEQHGVWLDLNELEAIKARVKWAEKKIAHGRSIGEARKARHGGKVSAYLLGPLAFLSWIGSAMRLPSSARIAFLVLTSLPATACYQRSASAPVQPEVLELENLPVELTVQQRSTTVVPGTDGALRLTIDDITDDQVMASLIGESGAPLLGPVSLGVGASERFVLGEIVYVLTLEELDQAWVGGDHATFSVSSIGPAGSVPKVSALSETEKIEQLIAHIGSREGAIFIRNEKEHTAAEAAEHLRSKWKAAGGRVSTAREFVERVATKSSLSGEPYLIRMRDGSEVFSGQYLGEVLDRIEQGR